MIIPQNFSNYLYNLLPQTYRTADIQTKYTLQKYLNALNDGGFSPVIQSINSFLDLVDPDKCPSAFFPYLFESFGLKYSHDIPESYQRKLLKNVGELNRRRGTYSVVHYLIRVLTGMEVDITYERVYNETIEERLLHLDLIATSMDAVSHMDLNMQVINKYLRNYIPFYIRSITQARTDTSLTNMIYQARILSYSSDYTLVQP